MRAGERVVKQKRKVLLIYTLVTLVMLLVSAIMVFYSIDSEFSSQVDEHITEVADSVAAGNIVRRSDCVDFLDPKVKVYYYSLFGTIIENNLYGSEMLQGVPLKLQDYNGTILNGGDITLTLAENARIYRVEYRVLTLPNELKANSVVVLYDITGEYRAYRSAIIDGIIIFAACFLLMAVLVYLVEQHRIRPYVRALNNNRRLFADMSHEYNTPLAVVGSMLGEILANPDATVQEVSDKLVAAQEEVGRLKRLTRDMLVLARSDNDTIAVTWQDCDLSTLVSESAEPFAMMAALQDKDIVLDINPGIILFTDADKVKQCLVAVLDNALKYTQSGDSITVRLAQEKDLITLEICDTGKGVSVEPINRIFERFYREDHARAVGGTGLGLAIVHAMVTQLGGTVDALHNRPHGLIIRMCWDATRCRHIGKRAGVQTNGAINVKK